MNQQLLDILLALKQSDSDTRSRLQQAGQLYGIYNEEMQQVHRDNALQLDRIISVHGWPGLALVGLEGCRAAWLIAQHSNCTPELQRKFLAAMRSAAEHNDIPAKQIAFLTDRIRFNENMPQVYGTILDWNETGNLSCVVEDAENLDARRQEVGLSPYQEELEKHINEVKTEGGVCPLNIRAYKQQGREWARSVGWLV